jgi:hypothetical protein
MSAFKTGRANRPARSKTDDQKDLSFRAQPKKTCLPNIPGPKRPDAVAGRRDFLGTPDMFPLHDFKHPPKEPPRTNPSRTNPSRTNPSRTLSRTSSTNPDPTDQDRLKTDGPQPNGGARRDRTDDLKLAKLALSQLSYGPVLEQAFRTSPRAAARA